MSSKVLERPDCQGNDGSGKKGGKVKKPSTDCPHFDPQGNKGKLFSVGMILGGTVHEFYGETGTRSPEQCKRLCDALVASDQVRDYCRGEFLKCRLFRG